MLSRQAIGYAGVTMTTIFLLSALGTSRGLGSVARPSIHSSARIMRHPMCLRTSKSTFVPTSFDSTNFRTPDMGRSPSKIELHAYTNAGLDTQTMTESQVGSMMTRDPVTLTLETDVLIAAQMMVERRLAGLPVVDEECNFLGMVSDLDIMTSDIMPGTQGRIDDLDAIFPRSDFDWNSFRTLKKQLKKLRGRKVREIMTEASDVIMVSPSDSIDSTANVLIRNRLRRVPVIWEGKLVGIVTRGDILRQGITRILRQKPSVSAFK
mmetsp:Transcript_30271/g.48521  ORF Transcript_30271/g.48521 Transcript_30271/m.48521 type:complete len:265 (-) Transcript_30271:355-1149(-)